jgi:hypothetical protein
VVISGTFLWLHYITLLILWTLLCRLGFAAKTRRFWDQLCTPQLGSFFAGKLNSVNLIFWHWRNVNIKFSPRIISDTPWRSVWRRSYFWKDSWTRHYVELSCFEVRDLGYTLPTGKSPGNPQRKDPFWGLRPVWPLCRRGKYLSLNRTSIPLSSSLWRNH